MTTMLIRTGTPPPEEVTCAYPHLTAHSHPPSTTLMGELTDRRDLKAVLDRLDLLGIRVVEVITVPD